MPKKAEKMLCVESLRHNEYYDMQSTFDELYAKSMKNEVFSNLMDIILRRENILLAYRNIKTNTGRVTPGTDGLTTKDVAEYSAEEVVEKVRFIVRGSVHGYRPRPIRRKDIPKPNGKLRPLGIPCIWDRLVQQCIKQVMEPICEAKFSDTSYGFRPGKSVENAIARTYQLMQVSKLQYVIEFDIKGFFDNVDHSKLIRQIWAMNIHDKELLFIIKRILKAPIKMPNGETVYPTKGTPQGGIISPLLANIVLNELDHWVENQWRYNPVVYKYAHSIRPNGAEDHGAGYHAMRNTNLKEMQIVRYADDFRIFCRYKQEAQRAEIAITKWLKERLKLEVSEEKTRVVNAQRNYMKFLGFEIKLVPKGKKMVIESHVCKNQIEKEAQALKEQIIEVSKAGNSEKQLKQLYKYNAMVMGIQNYYRIATKVSWDFRTIGRAVDTIMTNRFKQANGSRIKKTGRPLTIIENINYGQSKSLRYLSGINEPIYPVSYVQYRNPINAKRNLNFFTKEGRVNMHDNLRINTKLLAELMRVVSVNNSIEFTDNRISLFSAQWGRCAVTGREFVTTAEIHCHHKTPKEHGGTDEYSNLVLIHEYVHILIHATSEETIQEYLNILKLNHKELDKVNEYRKLARLPLIEYA